MVFLQKRCIFAPLQQTIMAMELNIDIDDIINSCSIREKKDLYQALLEDGVCLSERERLERLRQERLENEFMLMRELEGMTPFELKKTLCNLLGVGSYTDDESLRERLEPVITAS